MACQAVRPAACQAAVSPGWQPGATVGLADPPTVP